MADLAKLVVRFEAQTAQLTSELERTRKKLGKFSKGTKRDLSAVSVAFGVLAADAARASLSFANSQIQTADSLSKLSQSTGVAIEDLSKFDYALQLSGGSTEDLTKSINGLARSASDAARGAKNDSDAFAALGVSIKDVNGDLRPTEDLLLDVADAFAAAEDGAAKSAIAQELFGRSGTKLIPFLNNGREGLAELGDEAERLGIVLEQDAASSAEQFNDNMLRLEKVSQGVVTQLLQGVLPTLENLTNEFVESAGKARDFSGAAEGVATGIKLIVSAASAASGVLEVVGQGIGGLAAAAVALAQGEFSQAADILEMAFTDVKDIVVETAESVERVWEDAATTVDEAAEKTAESAEKAAKGVLNFANTTDELKAKAKGVKDEVTPALEALAFQAETLGKTSAEIGLYSLALDGATKSQLEYAETLYAQIDAFEAQEAAAEEAAKAAAKDAEMQQQRLDAAREALFNLEDFAKETSQGIQANFADFLFDPFDEGLGGMVKSFGKTMKRMVADAVAADLFGRINNTVAGVGGGTGFGGGFGSLLSSFAGFFDKGGTIPQGQFGIAGEHGPELVFGGQSVMSRRDTAEALSGGNNVTVNVAPVNNTADMRQAAGQGARTALKALQEAQRYG